MRTAESAKATHVRGRIVALTTAGALALAGVMAPAGALAASSTTNETSNYSATPTVTEHTATHEVKPEKEKTTPKNEVKPTTEEATATTTSEAKSSLPFTGLNLTWVVGAGALLLGLGLTIRISQRRHG